MLKGHFHIQIYFMKLIVQAFSVVLFFYLQPNIYKIGLNSKLLIYCTVYECVWSLRKTPVKFGNRFESVSHQKKKKRPQKRLVGRRRLQRCTGTTRGRRFILQRALIESVLAQDEEAQTGKEKCQYKIYKVRKSALRCWHKINVSEISKYFESKFHWRSYVSKESARCSLIVETVFPAACFDFNFIENWVQFSEQATNQIRLFGNQKSTHSRGTSISKRHHTVINISWAMYKNNIQVYGKNRFAAIFQTICSE